MKQEETIQEALTEKIGSLPNSPGVYLMKNASGKIIYVGKARDLKKRVVSYFAGVDRKDPKTKTLVSHIADLDYIVTDTENEALLTEGTLIKEYRPRYNVDLKDDKNYLCLRIDLADTFPRYTFVRSMKRDTAHYFGPFSSAKPVRDSLKWLSATFLLRQCSDHKFKNRSRPCLYHEINQCSAPCTGLIDEESYRLQAEQSLLFLEGKNDTLIRELTGEMERLSDEMRYEEAAVIRDRISAVKKMVETQKVVASDFVDRDVVGAYREGLSLGLSILFIRGGRLMGSRYILFKNILDDNDLAVQSFVEQFYRGDRYIPEELLLPVEIPDRDMIERWLSEHNPTAVKTPKRGLLRDLVVMADKNAESNFSEWKRSRESKEAALSALAQRLGLPEPPKRMECFDISNVGGTLAVGSMAVFVDGEADTSEYRHFRIKGVDGADDYAMMKEVLSRRMKHLTADTRPDIVFIDGGRGHLNIARAVMTELGRDDIPLAAVAKERDAKSGDRTPDKVYLPERKNPIVVRGSASALFPALALRDEAHRFAVTYHRRLRKKRGIKSSLDDIPGIGEKRKKALISHFKRLADIQEASLEELMEVPGISPAVAAAIVAHFRMEEASS